MMSLVGFFSQPVWHRLGLTLVHFSWQGLAVAVITCAVVQFVGLKRGNPRYAAYLLAFAVMAACPPITFLALNGFTEQMATVAVPMQEADSPGLLPLEAPAQPRDISRSVAVTGHASLRATLQNALQVSLPWVLVCWVSGVLILSVRLLLGFIGVYQWRRNLEPLTQGLEQRVTSLSGRLGMAGFSRVFVSRHAREVVALGYVRPMVLLPAAMVTQMHPEMLEAIIAHELAHLRRFDLWVNLAQRVIETLLFYHPAVWWLSHRVRNERELCCDELAVKVTGERLTYAWALESAGRIRLALGRPALALGLGQGRKSTLSRVRHILGLTPTPPDSRFWLAGVIAVTLLAILAMPTASVLTAEAKKQPTTQGGNNPAADSEKPEQPRFAARAFNSKLALNVWVRETSQSGAMPIGATPSATPLQIPPCWLWGVQLGAPVEAGGLLAREMSLNKIPGLDLSSVGTDSDLRYLAGLTELRYLDLTRTRITDAGVAYLGGLTGLEQLRLDGTRVTDAGLEHLKGLTRLQRLDLSGTKITDSGLEHLKGLTELRYLSLIHDRIADAGLAHLKGLSELRGLDLARTPITDVGLAHLKNLTRLQWMTLYQTKITDAGLKYLEGMKELEGLELHATAITDAGLEHLKGLTRLEELSLDDTRITDAGLTYLKGLTGLHDLWLSAPGITDAGLMHLEGLTELQELSLHSTQITDAGLAHLKGLTKLQGLWISAPRVTDAGLAHLAAMPGVRWRWLGLDDTQVTDAGLEHLKGMNALESLHLDGTQIGDGGLEHLKGLMRLQRLYLSNTGVTDAGLEHLKDLTGLRNLNLSGTQVTDAGVQQFQQALPNLTITRGQAQSTTQSAGKPGQSLRAAAADSGRSEQPRYAARTFNSELAFNVFVRTRETMPAPRRIGQTPSATPLEIPACRNWAVQPVGAVSDWDLLIREMNRQGIPGLRLRAATDADLSHLTGLAELQYLDLTRTEVTDTGLKALSGLSGLRELSLWGTKITDAGLAHLKGLTGLEELWLDDTEIGDAGMVHLKGLTRLQVLRVNRTKITDVGLEHVRGLSELRELSLWDVKTITDAGITHLQGLTKLQILFLTGTRITDVGLSHLQGLTGLQVLWLENTPITDAGLANMEGMTGLTTLSLSGTKITDAGLAHLKGLTQLYLLDLSGTQVTDAGLGHLRELARLQWLALVGTKITDVGLEHLKGMAGLQQLILANTQVTDVGIKQLQHSLPELTIRR